MKKKGKITLITLCAVAGLLLCGGLITGFLANRNLVSAPTVEVLDDGTSVYLLTQANEDYKGYRFKFTSNGQSFSIDSQTNIIDLGTNEKIKLGEKYDISVCYLGEMEGNNSKYSKEVSWQSYAYLASPQISLGDGFISWQAVEGASYYEVYAGDSMTIATSNKISFQELKTGTCDIFVVAHSNNANLKHSKPSNTLKGVKVVHTLSKITDIKLSGYNLTFNSVDKLDAIEVYIDENEPITIFVEGVQSTTGYSYSVEDISAVYKSGMKLGLAPKTDDYHFYYDEIVYYN